MLVHTAEVHDGKKPFNCAFCNAMLQKQPHTITELNGRAYRTQLIFVTKGLFIKIRTRTVVKLLYGLVRFFMDKSLICFFGFFFSRVKQTNA